MPPISHKKLQELFAQLMRIEDHRSAQAVKEIKKIYQSLLNDLQYYVSGIYANYAVDDSLTYFISSKHVEYARFLEAVRDRFLDAWDSNVQIITNTVEDVYKIAFNGFLNAVSTAANDDEIRKLFKDIRLTSADVIKAAVTNPVAHLTLSRTLNKNRAVIIDRINKTIETGITAGDRYSTMANKLVDAVRFGRTKAMRVIRTETHRVRETGHNNAAQDMDKKLIEAGSPYRWIKTWQNMRDSLVRGNPAGKHKYSPPDHWNMQGVTVLQNESFTLTSKKRGLVSAVCPGQSGTPDNDCNCRCTLIRDLVSDKEFFEKTGRHFPRAAAEIAADNSLNMMVDNSGKSGIIGVEDIRLRDGINFMENCINKNDEIIGRSVGASAKNYPVRLPDGNHAKFAEGSTIGKIKVFAGKGTDVPIRNAIYLEVLYGIPADEWQKIRGEAVIVENGVNRKVEVHWYEAKNEKHDVKVKRYFDES